MKLYSTNQSSIKIPCQIRADTEQHTFFPAHELPHRTLLLSVRTELEGS